MLASDNPEYPPTVTTRDVHKFALVVGVNNSSISSPLASLKHAEDDAIEVYRTLRQEACGFTFFDPVLTGSRAGTAEVRSAIIRLVDEKTDQDFILFYFLGHALPVRTKEGLSDIYFVTHNFSSNEVKRDPHAHLSMSWLRKILYQSEGPGKVLVILDCCYAGNMIEIRPDPARIQIEVSVDVRRIVEECLGGTGVRYQNGRLRVILTATGYNTPAQERLMTSLVLSALQGKEAKATDHKGYVNIHTLYTFLQDQMPQEQLPNLSGDFPRSCILAWYPHISEHHLKEARKIEENEIRNEIARLRDIITDPEYFKRLAEANTQFYAQQFDRLVEETATMSNLNLEKINDFFKRDRVQVEPH